VIGAGNLAVVAEDAYPGAVTVEAFREGGDPADVEVVLHQHHGQASARDGHVLAVHDKGEQRGDAALAHQGIVSARSLARLNRRALGPPRQQSALARAEPGAGGPPIDPRA